MLFKQLGQGEFLPLIFLLLFGVDALRKQPFIVCGDLSGRVQVNIGKAAYGYSPFTSLPEITKQEFFGTFTFAYQTFKAWDLGVAVFGFS